MKRILIPGGGTGGTLVANRLRRAIAPHDAMITVVDQDDRHVYGCKASCDLFGLAQDDLIDQVKDIITVGEFYELAAGGQIIFT